MTNEEQGTTTGANINAPAQAQLPRSNPTLRVLDALVGEWNVESPQYPEVWEQMTFEWLEGGAFLLQHADAKHAQFPTSTAIIGPDDSNETYCMLYYDSRDVSRIYQMSLVNGIWKLWRDAPGFSQRFTGTFSEDGNTITATWEKSSDGVNWERDFDLTYMRVR